jgi:hypothetical protein
MCLLFIGHSLHPPSHARRIALHPSLSVARNAECMVDVSFTDVCTMWPPVIQSVCRRSLQDAELRELSFVPESLRKLDSRLIFNHVLKISCRKQNEPRPLP